MEKQCAQSNQLCVALKHEQTAKDNLRKELQIEASRCEALLAQERGRLSELQRSLEAEQGRSRELSEALQHERLLTERLSRRPQDKQAQPALLQKLRGCEARVLELEVALEAAQQRALEAEAHVHRQDVEREQEVSAAPRPPVETAESVGEFRAARTAVQPRPSRADTEKWSRWQTDRETLVSLPRPEGLSWLRAAPWFGQRGGWKSGSARPPTLFFPKVVLDPRGPLRFRVRLRIGFSASA